MPRGRAWRVTTDKPLRRLLNGIAEGAPPDARDAIDNVFEQAFPATTSELAEWERQFGIQPNPSDTVRRQLLTAEWFAGGGQSPKYIQDVLQTAGFNLYVYEWWKGANVAPRTLRDPHAYTTPPLIGTEQCTPYSVGPEPDIDDPRPQCSDGKPDALGRVIHQAQCNRFLTNDPHYFDNKTLTDDAPPPIPDDPDTWPYFLYIGGPPDAFGEPTMATISTSLRGEVERLILKVRPLHNWIVTCINFTDDVPPAPPFFFGPSSPGFGAPWNGV